ncbi:MAG: NUDIX hydrolase [Gemmatimonadaceae bacterium]|nr:NUDIX hydrolase [Gemmatimonadaceae bacterium]
MSTRFTEEGLRAAGQVATRRAYEGKVISLDVDTVRFPDGSTGELEMIRHPGASAIVPFLSDPAGDDPQLLLIRQYRYAALDVLYEIPAGRLEAGEAPAVCAARELREETGCTAARLEHLHTMYTTPGFTDEKIHLFMATGLERGESAREADEFIDVEVVALGRALEMIRDGVIRDAKSALGILYCAGFHSHR